jgi:hypothetical protein
LADLQKDSIAWRMAKDSNVPEDAKAPAKIIDQKEKLLTKAGVDAEASRSKQEQRDLD